MAEDHAPIGSITWADAHECVEIVDTSGSATVKSLTSGVLGAPAAGIHWIANNVDYIKPLEEGWSKNQAPNGMVHVTVLEFQQVVREAANNV